MKAEEKPIVPIAGLLLIACCIGFAWSITSDHLRVKGATLLGNGGTFVIIVDIICFVLAMLPLGSFFVDELQITDEHIIEPRLFGTTVIPWAEATNVYLQGRFWFVESGSKKIGFNPDNYNNGSELVMLMLKHARKFHLVDI